MHIQVIKQQSVLTSQEGNQEVALNSARVSEQMAVLAMSPGDQMPSQANNTGDLFDASHQPIVYMSDNRMPVMIEFSSVIIYIIFAALLLTLVSILPGVRRKKLTSFLGLITILVVGASILLSLEGPYWLTGEIHVYEAPYGALTSETITGKLQVNIGLKSTNVTLHGNLVGEPTRSTSRTAATPEENSTNANASRNIKSKFVDYNERFQWDKPDRMADEHEEALRRGLPYPILTITEFLSQDSDGFNWMRQLRNAGYFTSFALYASLVSWCLTTIVMCVLPIYLPHMMQITGALMMTSVWIYTLLIQSPKSFVIQMGEVPMEFAFGYTYVITFMAGAVSMFAGVLMYILHMNKPNEQLTIMDCDSYLKNQQALYTGGQRNDCKLSEISLS